MHIEWRLPENQPVFFLKPKLLNRPPWLGARLEVDVMRTSPAPVFVAVGGLEGAGLGATPVVVWEGALEL